MAKARTASGRRKRAFKRRGPKTTPLNPRAAQQRAAIITDRRIGRPSLLTPEIRDRLIAILQRGSYVETAVATVGIVKHTFYQWVKRGARDKREGRTNEYTEFADAVEKAQAEAESILLDRIHRGTERSTVERVEIERNASGTELSRKVTTTTSPGEWTPAAWMLERKFPDRWGRRIRIGGDETAGPIRTQQGTMADYLVDRMARQQREPDGGES